MSNRAIVIGAILSALLLAGVNGCESETGPSPQVKTSGLPMKIAQAYWPGTYWVDIAHNQGWFEEAGLNVELVDTNTDYVASLTDTVNGKIDINGFSLFDLMSFNAAGANLVMIINADNSYGAEAILASPEINTLQALRGKNIGVSKGSYLEYILNEALNREGIDQADITSFDMLSENAGAEIMKDSVDAVVTFEPFVSSVLAKSNARKLFDTSEIPGISPNGSTFRRSFIDERPGDVQAFVNVWHKTTLFMQENPKQAFAIIAKNYDQTPGEVQAFMQLDKVLDLRENIVSYSFGSGFESLHGAARKINNFLIEKGVTDKQMDSTEFIDGRFLRSLSENIK
jgi:NitT/TauT family transport system substrate-binding protein